MDANELKAVLEKALKDAGLVLVRDEGISTYGDAFFREKSLSVRAADGTSLQLNDLFDECHDEWPRPASETGDLSPFVGLKVTCSDGRQYLIDRAAK